MITEYSNRIKKLVITQYNISLCMIKSFCRLGIEGDFLNLVSHTYLQAAVAHITVKGSDSSGKGESLSPILFSHKWRPQAVL